MIQYRGAGLENVYLKNGYTVREVSGQQAIAIHDLDGLHKAIAFELATQSGPMDGASFRFLRKYADLAQRAAAHMLDRTELTVSNWERGKHSVPGSVALVMRALVREMLSGNAHLKAAVDQYNRLDREKRELERLDFAETDKGWKRAA